MESSGRHTLPREERLRGRSAMEALFRGGHRSLSAYPLRAVYMRTAERGTSIVVSVPKRHFKRAVKRNRIKRQVREAYRLAKRLLTPPEGGARVAFLWTGPELLPSALVEAKVQNLLTRINESLSRPEPSV